MRSYLSRAIKIATVSAVILLLNLAVLSKVPLQLNRMALDFCINHGDTSIPSKQIYVVDFDEESVRRFGNPIPHRVLADVLRKVGAARPRIVGLNIPLDHPGDMPQQDVTLRDALTSAQSVIVSSGSSIAHMPLPTFCQPENAESLGGFCKEGTPGALGYSPSYLHADNDGVVRQIDLIADTHPLTECFALFLVEQFTGQPIRPNGSDSRKFQLNGRTMSFSGDDYFSPSAAIIIGRWSAEPATRIPAWKVVDSSVSLQVLDDKLVLIGQSHEAEGSQIPIPLFDPSGNDAHVIRDSTTIQAAAIDSLLEGTAIARANPFVTIFCMAMLILIAVTILLSFSLGAGVANFFTLMALTLGAR